MVGATWASEREAALQAARRGGEVLDQWAGRFTASLKGRNDLVTEADLAAQKSIRDFLLRRFPGDDFLGEEEPQDPQSLLRPRRWIVDPIDGTANFVHGFPFYCVSVGLEVEGELVVGVVFDPVRQEAFSAAKGQGSLCKSSPLRVSERPKLSESLINVGLPAVPEQHPESIATMTHLIGLARSMRRMGSAALALAYVAAGRIDAFVSPVIQPWDVAAGVVLVRESGGRVTNLHSQQYNPYVPNILATNGLLHEELQRELPIRG